MVKLSELKKNADIAGPEKKEIIIKAKRPQPKKKQCPHCKKMFVGIANHVANCSKNPRTAIIDMTLGEFNNEEFYIKKIKNYTGEHPDFLQLQKPFKKDGPNERFQRRFIISAIKFVLENS